MLDSASRVIVLAGPGVVRNQAVGGLHAFATAGHLGVLNSWGAKGVFHWRSRHHLATVGLQERDFELCGFDAADLLVAVGVDDRETPDGLWSEVRHLVVTPQALTALAESLDAGRRAPPDVPPLRALLAAITQAGWASDMAPVQPTRVTWNYAAALSRGGLVAADAGVAGYWVARTFATTRPGAALVPPTALPGWAAACVTVARLSNPMRPALGVIDGPLDDATAAVREAAQRLGIEVGIEAWEVDGEPVGPEAHLERLGRLAHAGSGGVATLATDASQMGEMIAVAGPVVAWRGATVRQLSATKE
jgi:acetolactate synthase-1/2/3 large subunit